MAAAFLTAGQSDAQQATTIVNYIRPFVAAEAKKQGNSWEWEAIGNGGYLMRMFIEVTGDDRNELFLTTSLATFKNQAEWQVFEIEPGGALRPYKKSLRFPSDSVWASTANGKPQLLFLAPPDRESQRLLPSEEWKQSLYRFDFKHPEITESRSEVTTAEGQELRPVDPNALPKLEVVLLEDYLTRPNAQWVAVPEWKTNAHDYFMRPEDAERISKNQGFTPQAALILLGTDGEQSQPPKSSPIPPPDTVPSTPSSQDATQAVQGASVNERGNVWLWVAVTIFV
ncbi:MAG TPA: hypothetical protein VM260_24110, partial [Pirellula sp.]|nr:hypothetical protein [Pirellula sp.]